MGRIIDDKLQNQNKGNKRSLETLRGALTLVVLAGGAAAFILYDGSKSIADKVRDGLTDVSYGQIVTDKKYKLVPYEIRPEDTIHTLVKIIEERSDSNNFAFEYAAESHPPLKDGTFKAGDTIWIPKPSPDGKTVDQLMTELYVTKGIKPPQYRPGNAFGKGN